MALGHTRCKQCYSRLLIIVINLTNHKDIKVHFVYPICFQILCTTILFIIKRVTLSQRIYFMRYIYRTILKIQPAKCMAETGRKIGSFSIFSPKMMVFHSEIEKTLKH